jgi:hypothetical protein
MQGEFLSVWSETFREIWYELAANDAASEDLFPELYRELALALKTPPTAQALAEIVADSEQSKDAFENTKREALSGERAVITFLENAEAVLDDLGGDALSNCYFNLLDAFIQKFNLRYDLRRPCIFCPTVPGVFSSLVRDLRSFSRQNPNMDKLMKEFEEAVRDLRYGCTEGRIKTCIGKNVMLLEAIGELCPGVTKKTLGDMCDQVGNWPHTTVREALKKIYGFTSDYSGMRHGSASEGIRRDVDMRDMIAISILLFGFTPYLTDQLDAEVVYRGK